MSDALNLRFSTAPWQMMLFQGPGATFYGMNASGMKYATIFQAQDTNAITHLGFYANLRQGTPPTYRVSLQGVDASTGYPDGTVKGGGSPASGTFTPPASSAWDSTFQWVALSNSYTPSRGEVLSLVIDYSSGTINGSNFTYFSDYINTTNFAFHAFPYTANHNGTSWSMTSRQNTPIYGVRTASTRYGFVFHGALYNTTSVSTSGYRQALKFNIPTGWCNTFKVKGLRWNGKIAAATGKNPIAGLWTSSTTLQDVTLDSDVNYAPTSVNYVHEYYFDESTLSTLTSGTDYYLGLQVADASSGDILLQAMKLSEANDSLCYPLGTNACFSSYNGSTWTDDATLRPCLEVILGDITGGGSSGGLMLRRNFDGGF